MLIEIIAVGTLYGGGALAWFRGEPERLIEDIEIMIGKRSKLWWFPWKVLWYIVTPILLVVLHIIDQISPKIEFSSCLFLILPTICIHLGFD